MRLSPKTLPAWDVATLFSIKGQDQPFRVGYAARPCCYSARSLRPVLPAGTGAKLPGNWWGRTGLLSTSGRPLLLRTTKCCSHPQHRQASSCPQESACWPPESLSIDTGNSGRLKRCITVSPIRTIQVLGVPRILFDRAW